MVDINGIPQINKTSLTDFLESYIEIVENIAIICSKNCPILLVGLPLKEKFGYKFTFGLFDVEQAKNLSLIIPEKYKDFFSELIKSDSSIKMTIDKNNKMPNSKNYIKMNKLLKYHKDQIKNNS